MAYFPPLIVGALAIALVGCQHLDPPQAYQAESLPDSYAAIPPQSTPTTILDLRQQDDAQLQQSLSQWWTLFKDPVLDDLVQRALSANWELRAAAQRIEQARDQITRVNSASLPTISAAVGASRQQTGTNSKLGFGLYDLYGFSANFAWEPDLFGRVAAQTRAAEAQLTVTNYERHGLMVATVAELVDSYAQLRTVQHLRTLTQQYIAVLQQQVTLTEQLAGTGMLPTAAVSAMRSELLAIQAQLPALNARIAALISTIAVLTGGFPQDLHPLLQKPAPMLSVRHPLPATLPSQLLAQRPDIAAQQARIEAALANVQAAQADFMPSFSIPLGIGVSSTPFDLLLNPASFIWNLGVSLSAPLYTGQALEANLAIAQAINREDQLRYEGLVRQALKEVGDAIIAYQQSLISLKSTTTMTQQQQQVLQQQERLFHTGQTSRLQLNQTKLQWLAAQQSLTDARYASVTQLTMLYRALGGGWQPSTDTPRAAH